MDMIKPNELMTGNLISYTEGGKEYFLKVSAIRNEKAGGYILLNTDITPITGPKAYFTYREDKFSKFKYVELTEEWLKKDKFNFEKRDKGPILGVEFWGKGDFEIVKSYLTGFFTFEMLTNDRVIQIEYVHQLQNLYFSLKGEELQLKQ